MERTALKGLEIRWGEESQLFWIHSIHVECVQVKVWGEPCAAPIIRRMGSGQPLEPFRIHRFNQPCRFVHRLRATAGGRAADWLVQHEARPFLSEASYEPMFRGWLESFRWAPSAYWRHVVESPLDLPTAGCIWQWGSEVPNFVAALDATEQWMTAPQPEQLVNIGEAGRRELLRQALIAYHLSAHQVAAVQGRLTLYAVLPPPPELVSWSGRQTVFNHFFPKGAVHAQARDRFLVHVQQGSSYVIDLEGEHKPILLDSGWYIARHF